MYGRERSVNMSTRIRPEISEKNKYWISRHRYYELKHFCLQYPTWKRVRAALDDLSVHSPIIESIPVFGNIPSDPTAKYAIAKEYYSNKIKMVERVALEADPVIGMYVLRAVTEELSYNYLKMKLGIPCGKDMYYDRYRKFFWLLSKERQ